jgi:hypothetical protein
VDTGAVEGVRREVIMVDVVGIGEGEDGVVGEGGVEGGVRERRWRLKGYLESGVRAGAARGILA